MALWVMYIMLNCALFVQSDFLLPFVLKSPYKALILPFPFFGKIAFLIVFKDYEKWILSI